MKAHYKKVAAAVAAGAFLLAGAVGVAQSSNVDDAGNSLQHARVAKFGNSL